MELVKLRFLQSWQDLDGVFPAGTIITLPASKVKEVKERMREYGPLADLVEYGKYLIPLSFLEEEGL